MSDVRSPVLAAFAALGEPDVLLSDTRAEMLGRVAVVEALAPTLLKGRRDLDIICDTATCRLASGWAKHRHVAENIHKKRFTDRVYAIARERIGKLRNDRRRSELTDILRQSSDYSAARLT